MEHSENGSIQLERLDDELSFHDETEIVKNLEEAKDKIEDEVREHAEVVEKLEDAIDKIEDEERSEKLDKFADEIKHVDRNETNVVEKLDEVIDVVEDMEEDKKELMDEINSRGNLNDAEVRHEVRESIEKAYIDEELKQKAETAIMAEAIENVVEDATTSSLTKKLGVSNGSFGDNGDHSNFHSEAQLVTKSVEDLNHLKHAGAAVKERKFRSIVCALVVCLGSFNMGTVIGYPSPAVPNMNKPDNPFHLDDDQSSWVGSIITLAALFGGLVGGIYMDKVGRKLGLMVMSLPLAVGWIIIVSSPTYGCLLAGRALTGLTIGIVSMICPVYIGEISPPSIRGVLGSCHQLLICIGILYTYCFGYFLSWQWLVVCCLATILLMMLGLAYIVESPRYLLSVGDVEACKESLTWLRGEDVDVSIELQELREAIEVAKDQATIAEFLQPQLWKPLAISVGLMIFQQFCGINVVMFYTVQIFTLAQIDMDPNVQTIVVGVVGVVGTCVSVGVSDLVGRRILLLASGFLMALSMAGLGTFFYELDVANEELAKTSLPWLPVTCLVLFNFGFDVAYGPIPWLMMGELFPLRAKGLASSIATASNWLCAFIMTKFWVNMTDTMGAYGGYWFCAGFCVLSMAFLIAFVPETKGKSLEDIEKYFK